MTRRVERPRLVLVIVIVIVLVIVIAISAHQYRRAAFRRLDDAAMRSLVRDATGHAPSSSPIEPWSEPTPLPTQPR